MKRELTVLKEENRSLKELVDNTASRMQLMEGMVNQQRITLETQQAQRDQLLQLEDASEDFKVELVQQIELLPQSTIEVLLWVHKSQHVIVTGLTHNTLSVFSILPETKFIQDLQRVSQPVSGMCEVSQINSVVTISLG
jgi:hypothetical protein